MLDEEQLIKACIQQNHKAQRQLYEQYDARFFAVCKRYFSDIHQAEDALVKGFLKIFQHIQNYSFQGNFEGWMHRIMVNECLMEIRKNKQLFISIDDGHIQLQSSSIQPSDQLDQEDLMQLLNALPPGCKLVFTLYVIEGYKHKEIAENLGITEGTSKSQLNLAKSKLRELLANNEHFKNHLL